MNDSIIVNGVKYIRADEVKKRVKNRTGYETAYKCETFWFDTFDGIVNSDLEDCCGDRDVECHAAGNYYTDETIAENNARTDELMRRLRQWQALNDEPVDWSDGDTEKWRIVYQYDADSIDAFLGHEFRTQGGVYFTTDKKAKEAIEVFRDELKWYFTEYQSRLDERAKV